MSGWHHEKANWLLKSCANCGVSFRPFSGSHKFCSEKCKGRYKYVDGTMSTENQYKLISGNWKRYFQRLLYAKGRESLTTESLVTLLNKQEGKCALTGVTLTCILDKGNRAWTNASIDRVEAGGPYILDNIRLTCIRVNIMRSNMTDNELLYWCKLLVDQKEGN